MWWGNPFLFQGRVGRAKLWLILIALSLIGLMPIPVREHKIILSSFGGWGEDAIFYATPVEPITATNWIFWGMNGVLTLVTTWMLAAAVMQRLRDLGVSWKWAAGYWWRFSLVQR